jgi:hypothetical protein
MSISTYSELVTAVARHAFRSDLTADIPNFIQLCEADMQVRLKNVDFEDTETLNVTAGVAALPIDYRGMRNVYWNGDYNRALQYLTPDKFDGMILTANQPNFYTIKGTNIVFLTSLDGTSNLNYKASFTGLSGSNATNSIITRYPDAYLHGTMMQMFIFSRDAANAQVRQAAYEQAIDRIIRDNNERKYGAVLQVRPA